MASIVSCPGCQKRLKLGTDKPGGKLRCPGCNTPFVLGSRTSTGSGGTPEFQAFELFEENVVTDTFVIEEEPPPAPKPRPMPKSTVPTPRPAPPKPAPLPPPPAPPSRREIESPTVFVPSLAWPSQSPTAPDDTILPEDFGLIEEKPAPKAPPPPPPPPPRRPAPKVATGHSEKVSSSADFVLEPPPAPKPPAKPAPPPAPAPAAKSGDFFLPADFDPFAAPPPPPAKTAVPDLSLDDGLPKLIEEPPPIFGDFDIVEEPVKRSSDGVAVVDGITEREAAEIAAARPVEEDDLDPGAPGPDRSPRRREHRRRRARKSRIDSDVRGRWAIVHWGLTVELIALGLFVLAIVLMILGAALAILTRSMAGAGIGGILTFVALGLLMLRELLVMLGYGLCIPAPTKNNAWLWAVLALAFALAALVGNVVAIIFPLAILLVPLTLMSWFFYLIYLKSLGEALKLKYIEDEAVEIMKLLGLQFIMTLLFQGGAMGLVLFIRPKTDVDLGILGWVFLTCGCVFLIISLILGVGVIYKYYFVLMNVREEIGWRLDASAE